MRYLLAPMEGVTTWQFRRAFARYYGGVDEYFTPFISLHRNRALGSKEIQELLPENNPGIRLVPQVLTNDGTDFLQAEKLLREYGYRHINVNFGCPSGTVAPKKKGAGILADLPLLERFLDQVFAGTEAEISVKTRIGYERVDEWEALFRLYGKYPLTELIVHPRCRCDYYKGTPDRETFRQICQSYEGNLVYNGDIFTVAGLAALEAEYPRLSGVMLGRGLAACPGLLRGRAGGAAFEKDRLKAFHDDILAAYEQAAGQEEAALFRMKELWFYLAKAFGPMPRQEKQLLKSRSLAEYRAAVSRIFREVPFTEDPERSIRF